MHYINEIRAFYDWLETNKLSTSAIVLWHALMHIANKTRWQDTFAVAVSVLEIKTGLKKQAIYDARNALKGAGLINFEKRAGNQSAIYSINSFEAAFVSDKQTQINTYSDKRTQHPTYADTQEHNHSPRQSPTINKQDNTIQKNNNTQIDFDLQEVVRAWDRVLGKTVSTYHKEELAALTCKHGKDSVLAAIAKAADRDVINLAYVKAVLKNKQRKKSAEDDPTPEMKAWLES